MQIHCSTIEPKLRIFDAFLRFINEAKTACFSHVFEVGKTLIHPDSRLTGPGEPDSWSYFSFYHHDQLTTTTMSGYSSIEPDDAATPNTTQPAPKQHRPSVPMARAEIRRHQCREIRAANRTGYCFVSTHSTRYLFHGWQALQQLCARIHQSAGHDEFAAQSCGRGSVFE